MADKWRQSDHHFAVEWQHPEDSSSLPPSSAPYSDAQFYPYEPLYPVNGTESARSSPFGRVVGNKAVSSNTNIPSQVRSGTNPSTAGSVYSRNLLNDSGVASPGCMSPPGFYVPISTTPTSPYHNARPNANIQHSESVTYGEGSPRVPHLYEATVPLNPTVVGTTDSGSWYYNALPHTFTGDSSDSIPAPGGTPHVYKEVVASESVVDASVRRRNPESAARYQCTGFGNCSSTFTTIYNLQSNLPFSFPAKLAEV
ncbi:hypothetical protein Moror_3968 [Moniliophthora roreri MCA 2997]|uniref:Uncharacterized protein n=1 Tax=Moniliophthora roreri (strain MCA 2997) TaxID=1381753 RepID=V2X7X3_MONRO|nr:hypothetical protein Moror_3968 [Moniliophthora roreri MCA 2997]